MNAVEQHSIIVIMSFKSCWCCTWSSFHLQTCCIHILGTSCDFKCLWIVQGMMLAFDQYWWKKKTAFTWNRVRTWQIALITKLYSWTNNLWIMKPLQGKASQYCTCIMIWRNENLMTRTQSTHQTCKCTHNSEVVQIESGKLPKNGHYTNGLQLLVRSITQKKLSIHQQSDLRLSTIYKTWGACRLHIRPSQFSQSTHWVPQEPSWISLSSKRGS